MLIESLAQKTKLAMMTVLATIGGCAVICGFTIWCYQGAAADICIGR